MVPLNVLIGPLVSTQVSLGAVIPDSSEASVSTALGLKDYIPVISGALYHILSCGDVIGTDKTQNQNLDLRYDGLIESPPEFQKEHLFHEVRKTLLL